MADTENALKRLVQQVEEIWEAVTRNGTKTTTTGKIPASTLILRNPELLAREEEKVFMRWNRERVAFGVRGELKIHVLGHGYYEVEKKKLLCFLVACGIALYQAGNVYCYRILAQKVVGSGGSGGKWWRVVWNGGDRIGLKRV